jgi:hexokinase
VQSEPKIQAALANVPGSIGIAMVTNSLESTTLKARLKNTVGDVVADSVTAAYRCQQDTFNVIIPAGCPTSFYQFTCLLNMMI